MVAIGLSAGAVARIRFAVSSLWEVVTSLRVLRDPAAHPVHLPWVERVTPALRAAGLAGERAGLLWQLVPAAPAYLPDFLTPQPLGPGADLDAELALLCATPSEVVRTHLHRYGLRPPLACAFADPAAGLARIAEEVRRYWEIALAPHWPRIRTLLDAELHRQARRLAEGGAELLLNELHQQVRWNEPTLSINQRHCTAPDVADGHGLVLVPSCFAWPSVLSVPTGTSPQLAYPARGAATLWERTPTDGTPLHAVLGRNRARLLVEMCAPVSTTELAKRTGISPSAVSQHLAILRAAGLVSTHRHGKAMLNARTTAADTLLSAAVM